MNNDTGTFHTEEEVSKMKAVFDGAQSPSFTVFAPGETVVIKGQEFVVCRTKNDRLILRSIKLPATEKEQKILQEWRKDHTMI